MEGGLSVSAWVVLWKQCHAMTGDGVWRVAWPDGGALIDQPALTVSMFDVVTAVVMEARNSNGR